MAHNINEIDFQQGREQAWHGLTDVQSELSLKSSRFASFEYIETPTFLEWNGNRIPTGEKRLIASDIGQPVGISYGEKRTQFTNGELLEMLESALANSGAELVSCGTVRDRESRFFSFSLKGTEKFQAGGKECKAVFTLLDDIRGRHKLLASLGITTVVCANTFAASLGEADEKGGVKHTLNARNRIPDFKAAIEKAVLTVGQYANRVNKLAEHEISTEQAKGLFAAFLAQDVKGEFVPVMSRRSINAADEMVALFLRGAGNKGETLEHVWSAATDFYSHASAGGDNKLKQFESSEFGAAAKAKGEFWALINRPVKELAKLAKVGNDLVASSLVALDNAKVARATALAS